MVLNRADECRQRADECRRSAAQAADDVLRVTYLDLARRWRMMEAESIERKAMGPTKPIPRTAERDRDALLTFYDLPAEPPAISGGAGLEHPSGSVTRPV